MRKQVKPQRSRTLLLPVVLLLVLTVLAYSRIWGIGFVSVDDPAYVTQNRHVLDGVTGDSLRWAVTAFHSANWHPLTWVSHMLDVQIYGMQALGHHLTNLIFHLGSVLLLFLVCYRLTQRRWRSVFIAALFAVHPLHVESVAWVAERKDVLSTFFCFLTLLMYVGYVRRPGTRRYIAVFAALALGLMAKPMLVSVPLLLLLLDFWPLGRKPGWPLIGEKLPLFGLALGSCIVTYIAQKEGGAVGDLEQYPLGVRLANASVAAVGYLLKTVWPAKLSVLYPHPGTGLPVWQVAASAVALAVVTYAVLRWARRVPYLAVGWLWYLITLLPVIGLIQVGKQAMADRYTYIPLTGIFIALTWAGGTVAERLHPRSRLPLAAASVVIIAGLAIMTLLQTGCWRSGVMLFRQAVAVSPDSYMVRYCLADAYLEEGRTKEAIRELKLTLQLKPDAAAVRDVLGYALARDGHADEGIKEIRAALRQFPRLATAWNNLGGILLQQGATDEALRCFRRAVELKADYAEAHLNLASALDRKDRPDEAEKHYQLALKADPRSAPALGAMGLVRFRQGDFGEAEKYLTEAVRIDPEFYEAQLYLGASLVQQGEYDEAVVPLTIVTDARPKWPVPHYNLAMALFRQGAYQEAYDELEASIRLGMQPDARFVEALRAQLRQ